MSTKAHQVKEAVEWPHTELPEGWAEACIPDLIGHCGLFSDGDWVESKDQDPFGDVRLIQLADVGDGIFRNKSRRFLTSAKARELGCTFLKAGDVLIARMPDPLGRACIFPGDEKPSITAVDVCIIRPDKQIDSPWLAHTINSPLFRTAIEAEQKGTTRGRISRSSLASLKLPVPPSEEQERISDKLKCIGQHVGQARQHATRAATLITAFRQAILAAACSGRLTEDWRDVHVDVRPAASLIEQIKSKRREIKAAVISSNLEATVVSELPEIPESWVWTRFGFVMGELRNGISTRPQLTPPGTPILRISSVRGGKVLLDEHRFLPGGENLADYRLCDGDLLFTRYNGTLDLLGVCGMIRGLRFKAMLYPDKLMRVRFDHAFLLPAYAEIFFQTPWARDRITEKSKSSAGQQGVSGGDVKAQPFAFPPLEEQNEIVRRVEGLFKLADAIEKRVAAATIRSERLTQAVLAKAFRGELVPTEAELARREGREYEPASVSLERIKAEKSKPEQNPKKPSGRSARTGGRS